MLAISFSFIPRVVHAGVPRRNPLGRKGGRRSSGMTCLFCRDADGVERSFGGPSIGAKTRDRIDHDEMIVSAAGDERHAFREKRRRESALALRNVVRVFDKRRLHCGRERPNCGKMGTSGSGGDAYFALAME